MPAIINQKLLVMTDPQRALVEFNSPRRAQFAYSRPRILRRATIGVFMYLAHEIVEAREAQPVAISALFLQIS